MHIDDLRSTDSATIDRASVVLVDAFRGISAAWPDLDAARAEVVEALTPGQLVRVARDDEGAVLGWIGGIPTYDGRVWEVHPLAVAPAHQRRGVGRALLADLEDRVRERGGLTLWLGADDEVGRTSLGGVDPYPDLLGALAGMRNVTEHPFEFYLKCGFVLAGIVPDANGWGRPDILMAKRVSGARTGAGADASRPGGPV